ncbi:translocation/assembly module TamB domain-containing protein, partial [Candidatus Glomeribacter gigasporarum]|uniref:translocation/assembly module TamB domain-containing protein n=1 Tax=Candidatus Glomeribacter gigasporarum TaxID=132144 RepID=UPI0005B2870F
KNIGILLGPQTLLDGRSALRLAVSGSVAQPKFSGALNGEGLSITWIDQGVTLKNGVVRIAIANNRADFQKVEFQGASGALRATGSVTLDRADTPLSVQIVADALELFARPDRQLSISGRATMANRSGSAGGFAIDGDFTVHRAFFNLPSSPAPKLGEDVVIVRADDPYRSAALESLRSKDAPPKIHLFQTRVGIDLGKDFRFRGAGADLDLVGKITLSNAAGAPLRAHGDLRARRGSTYEILSVKLDVEKGYVSFNGPVDNPALNILAMRRNQEVEVGLQVRGTTRAPRAQLVSEPNVPDTEKLSWLLFRHGTDKGATVGQQYAKNAALAFLGSMGGKQIAQRIGLDELSISQSEIGLTDPQVITLAKALNRHFILGYEEGLSSSAHIFKVTWQFWRSWSIIAHTGTVNGVNLLFSRRFD